MQTEYDAIIVGGGPAGLSAALLLGRCLRRVMVCDAGNPRNSASKAMHAFLGQDGIDPAQFLKNARHQLGIYDTVIFTSTTVDQVERKGNTFFLRTSSGRVLSGRALLLATGVRDALPKIPLAQKYYGVSLHHCPYCDAWEHRGEHIGVVGCDENAVNLALELLLWSSTVSLYTNGSSLLKQKLNHSLTKNRITIVEGRISDLLGSEAHLSHIVVEAKLHSCDALFFSPVQIHQSELAESLGCALDRETGAVMCGNNGSTNIKGVFAAGNLSQGIQMAVMASAEGLSAAAAINDWLIAMDTHTPE